MENIDEENICVDLREPSKHGHILKSQGAAELCVQLIVSIHEVLNAEGDITYGYLR